MKTISPQELNEKKQAGEVDLIDVRTPVEFREVHISYAKNHPLDQLDPEQLIANRNGRADDPIYVICRSGNRGEMACKKFHQIGFDNVVNVEGGVNACQDADLPIIRGKKTMSLERQVRIAAGLLVVLGVALGYAVSPWFHLLAGFVGAGLTFAGITDTCGMGMLIAKMPWNQVPQCEIADVAPEAKLTTNKVA